MTDDGDAFLPNSQVIGVLVKAAAQAEVREFFELFKTPWGFYRQDSAYDVLIVSGAEVPQHRAKLVLLYGGTPAPFDAKHALSSHAPGRTSELSYQGEPIPIYGDWLTFEGPETLGLIETGTGRPAALELCTNGAGEASCQSPIPASANGQRVIRVGFDLFGEVRHLLTRGQPAIHARMPALERHIALVRDLILRHSIPVVEIPPLPEGHNFIACLTHDIDHAMLRNHKCDHTMFGFLYRALVGSFLDLCRGRKTARQLLTNWAAAAALPFVYLGLAKDFWGQFERYLELEKGLTSTFFVIPRKGDPGQDAQGRRPPLRAAGYEAKEIADVLRRLRSAGREIGLHGIDAWRETRRGQEELVQVRELAGGTEVGVRMHWLYFDEQSPVTLENAGFSYDSTSGYNEAIGYRAGTTQVFKPLIAARLLELPLHIMDTALFLPSRMNLAPREAQTLVDGMVQNATRFGGALTVNWHDRSIAPERLWDDFYVGLLKDLKRSGAWFPTAGQAVSWFRKRRSAFIESVAWDNETVTVKASQGVNHHSLPGLRLRVYKPRSQAQPRTDNGFVDIPFVSSGVFSAKV